MVFFILEKSQSKKIDVLKVMLRTETTNHSNFLWYEDVPVIFRVIP